MKMFLLAIVSGLLSFSIQAQNRSLGPAEIELQKLLLDPALKHGAMAFMAVNLDNGNVIAEHNIAKSMVPASIQKIVTTSAAFELLGPDHTFKTTFGYSGAISAGELDGNIFVIAGGDPTLESRYFPEATLQPAIDFFKEEGITKVLGRLDLELGYFSAYTTPRGWVWEDMGNYFGASPTSLMWMDNLLEVKLRSGQQGTRAMVADISPKPEGVDMDIEVMAADTKRDDAWFFSAPNSDAIYAQGEIPMHRPEFMVKASNPKVAQTFANALLAKTKLLGTDIRLHQKKTGNTPVKTMSITSPPLSEIVKVTNERSVNLFAEALLLHLDKAEEQRSTEAAISALEAYLKTNKVTMGGVRIIDGSGLSPLNRMTCQAMLDVLTTAYRSKNFNTFKETLPVAGNSGTLASSFKNAPLAGNLAAKSGTMNGVRNYAGYVKNSNGETIAFCIMLNDYDASRRTVIMQKIESLLVAVTKD